MDIWQIVRTHFYLHFDDVTGLNLEAIVFNRNLWLPPRLIDIQLEPRLLARTHEFSVKIIRFLHGHRSILFESDMVLRLRGINKCTLTRRLCESRIPLALSSCFNVSGLSVSQSVQFFSELIRPAYLSILLFSPLKAARGIKLLTIFLALGCPDRIRFEYAFVAADEKDAPPTSQSSCDPVDQTNLITCPINDTDGQGISNGLRRLLHLNASDYLLHREWAVSIPFQPLPVKRSFPFLISFVPYALDNYKKLLTLVGS